MEMNKTPGVNLMLEYVMPQQVAPGKTYSGNMDYINREEVHAEKNELVKSNEIFEDFKEELSYQNQRILIKPKSEVDSYKGYLGYMDRDQAKSTTHDGMFDLYRDQITDKQRYFYEKKHDEAFEKNALLWRPIISFDNEWLKEQGILEGNVVHDEKIKQATRKAVNELVKERQLDVHWVGQIHYNTGNIHVHISMVEKEPIDIDSLDHPKKHGILSLASSDQAKSKIVNTFLDRTQQQQQINELIRNQMVQEARKRDFHHRYNKRFDYLSQRLSTYQYGRLKPHEKKWINDLTESILTKDFKYEYQAFQSCIKKEREVYERAYGIGERELAHRYSIHREQDLKSRFGNAILSQIKDYKKGRYLSAAQELKESRRAIRPGQRSFYQLKNQLKKETKKALREYEKLQQDLDKGREESEMER